MEPTVTTSGPFFDADLKAVMGAALVQATRTVAETGVLRVREQLDNVLVNPTGRYRASIDVERKSDTYLVRGDRVVYGAWLEGTSSRNTSTRFKGYAAFRRTTQKLQADVVGITRATFQRLLVGKLT